MQFKIDTTELVELTNKLEKAHKSAMPVAVRGTLDDGAFNMKLETIPVVWRKKFTVRKASFIRAHTGVKKSPNTFNLNAMIAKVGIIKGKSSAGDNLIKQEFGGVISGDKIIPTAAVRVSNSVKKLVSKKYYYNKFKKTSRGIVMRNKKRTIIRTEESLLQVEKGGRWKTLYRHRSNVKIDKRPFMQPAQQMTSKKMPSFYLKRAKKQFERLGYK